MFLQTDFMLPAVTYFANTTDLFLPDIQLLAPTNVSSFLDKPVLFIPVFLKRNISIPPITFSPYGYSVCFINILGLFYM